MTRGATIALRRQDRTVTSRARRLQGNSDFNFSVFATSPCAGRKTRVTSVNHFSYIDALPAMPIVVDL